MKSIIIFLQMGGAFGLFLLTSLEAMSIPLPGNLATLLYGFIMDWNFKHLLLISFVNSLFYVTFSLVPFFIGSKLENSVNRIFGKQKIEKAQKWFNRYGSLAIIFSRPTPISAYISYVSGMSKIHPLKFYIYSFIGIFPWITLLLYVGSLGDIHYCMHLLRKSEHISYLIIGIAVLIIIPYFFFIKQMRAKKNNTESSKIANGASNL
jgi:membrane protein DedA with SNARE-associated domain